MRQHGRWTVLSLIILATLYAEAEAGKYHYPSIWYFPAGGGAGSYSGAGPSNASSAPTYPASGPIAVYSTYRRGWLVTDYRPYNAPACGWSDVTRVYKRGAHHLGSPGFTGWGDELCGDSAARGASMSDGVPADAQIISDDVLGEEGQSEAIEEGQSADANPATFRLAGYRKAGDEAFRNGLDSSRMGAMNEALSAFQRAAQADPQNALYHYHQALTLYDMSGADAARDTLRQAVRAEQRAPIKDWGKRMERVQGPARLWVEKARRDAGLSR